MMKRKWIWEFGRNVSSSGGDTVPGTHGDDHGNMEHGTWNMCVTKVGSF
jgi:hypothetical protein